MKLDPTNRFLEKLLAGHDPDPEEIRELSLSVPEDLYIDFKHGEMLSDTKRARNTLRQYASAFANADGGVLIVGISDGIGKDPSTRKITPTERPGGLPLDEWATRVLKDLAGFLSPPPRIRVVTIDGSEVLILAVPRAHSLVPCIVEGRLCYYLRFGDSTLEMPPFLLSDLFLGRRSHPILQVRGLREGFSASIDSRYVTFSFELENTSLVPASDVVVGVIARASQPPEHNGDFGSEASEYLKGFIDVKEDKGLDGEGETLATVHINRSRENPTLSLPPFSSGMIRAVGKLHVPARANGVIYAQAAVYALPFGHPPQWFQMTWWLRPVAHGGGSVGMTLSRCETERPIVAWNVPPPPR